jgi:hypothetical protein
MKSSHNLALHLNNALDLIYASPLLIDAHQYIDELFINQFEQCNYVEEPIQSFLCCLSSRIENTIIKHFADRSIVKGGTTIVPQTLTDTYLSMGFDITIDNIHYIFTWESHSVNNCNELLIELNQSEHIVSDIDSIQQFETAIIQHLTN